MLQVASTQRVPGSLLTLRMLLRNVMGLVFAGVLLLGLHRLYQGVWFPFVWPDLAVTQLVATWMLGGLLVSLCSARSIESLALLVATGLLLLLCWTVSSASAISWWIGSAVRTFEAISLATLSQGLVGLLWHGGHLDHSDGHHIRGSGAAWVFSLCVAVLVPGVYSLQRVEDKLARFGELVDQQRLGTAHQIAVEVLAIQSAVSFRGQPLQFVERQLRMELESLRAENVALSKQPQSAGVRLQRATMFAICSDSSAAERLARELVHDRELGIEAWLLLGTLYEEQMEWAASLEAYSRALSLLDDQKDRVGERVRAFNGIGFAERKLGNRPAAEAAYQSALELEPNASAHFLLAQFYEDVQQADQAAFHARTAIRLDPARYATDGKMLLEKLQVHHLGCFSVYRIGNAGN